MSEIPSRTMYHGGFGQEQSQHTSVQNLGQIYKKHKMKPMRRSLQLARDAPFVHKRQHNSGSVQAKQVMLPNVRNRGLNVNVVD